MNGVRNNGKKIGTNSKIHDILEKEWRRGQNKKRDLNWKWG